MTAGTAGLDEATFRSAYASHSGELFAFCLGRLGERDGAHDAVQDTFLRAWRAADRYDPAIAGVRTWLYAIARSVVVDHLRRRATRSRTAYLADVTTAADPPIRDAGDARVDTMVVEEALRRLSREHRVVVVETYLKGRPAAEVAAELGVPAGTVRSRLYYALKALRTTLDEMGVER